MKNTYRRGLTMTVKVSTVKERFEKIKELVVGGDDLVIARQLGFKTLEEMKRQIEKEERGLLDNDVLTTSEAIELISSIINKTYSKAAFRAQLKKKTLIKPLEGFPGRANCFDRKKIEAFAHFIQASEEELFKLFENDYLKKEKNEEK